MEWVVAGLIVQSQTFLLYGQRKAGKTFAAIDLGLCVATGRDYHGRKAIQGRVLHVLGEGNRSAVRNRVWAWIQINGKDDAERRALTEDIERNWFLVARPVLLDDPDTLGEFLEQVGGPWGLVLLDPLLRHTSGDINSMKDAGAFMAACGAISETTAAAVLIVHHSGKDQSRGAMGSTVYEAAVDGAAVVVDLGNHRQSLEITLLRDAVPPPPLTFERVRVEDEPTFEDDSPAIASAALRLVAAKAGLLESIASDNQPTTDSLAASMGVDRATVFRRLKAAREAGLVVEDAIRLTPKGLETL